MENEIIIYCYHGNTSYGAAGYFMENGFKNVSSMEGGFETWRQTLAQIPKLIERPIVCLNCKAVIALPSEKVLEII